MPKETTIGVSKATKMMLREFKSDIGVKSLESAIKIAVGWAKSYHDYGLIPQIQMANKIEDLESRLETLEKIIFMALKEPTKKEEVKIE